MKDNKKQFDPHLIRTKMIKYKAKYSAFVTWKSQDLQEYGETERNAVLFLLERHANYLGVDDIKSTLNRLGLYA